MIRGRRSFNNADTALEHLRQCIYILSSTTDHNHRTTYLLLLNRLMQIMRPLIRHLRTQSTLIIHKLRPGHDPPPDLRRDLDTLARIFIVAQQHLEGVRQPLHRHEDAEFLGAVVDGLVGGDVGADLVGADGVQGDGFFGEDGAEGADEADYCAAIDVS